MGGRGELIVPGVCHPSAQKGGHEASRESLAISSKPAIGNLASSPLLEGIRRPRSNGDKEKQKGRRKGRSQEVTHNPKGGRQRKKVRRTSLRTTLGDFLSQTTDRRTGLASPGGWRLDSDPTNLHTDRDKRQARRGHVEIGRKTELLRPRVNKVEKRVSTATWSHVELFRACQGKERHAGMQFCLLEKLETESSVSSPTTAFPERNSTFSPDCVR